MHYCNSFNLLCIFIKLKEISSNSNIPKLTNGDLYIAVHSDKLLQDRINLSSILKPFFGKRLKVLDANSDMKHLYDSFTKLSEDIINCVDSLFQKAKVFENVADLTVLEERLSRLRQLNNPHEVNRNKKPSLKTRKALSRFNVFNPY